MMSPSVRSVLTIVANLVAIVVLIGVIHVEHNKATQVDLSLVTQPDSSLPVGEVRRTERRALKSKGGKGKGSSDCVPLGNTTEASSKGKGGKGKGYDSAAPVSDIACLNVLFLYNLVFSRVVF